MTTKFKMKRGQYGRLRCDKHVEKKKKISIFTFDPGPSSQPSSWLTLHARLMADILRGWVTTMLQGCAAVPPVNRSSRRNWGIWVLFPLPVSPATTTTGWRCKASRTRCRCWKTGSCSRSALKVGRTFNNTASFSTNVEKLKRIYLQFAGERWLLQL